MYYNWSVIIIINKYTQPQCIEEMFLLFILYPSSTVPRTVLNCTAWIIAAVVSYPVQYGMINTG
jgi:hypothetical protein